MTILQKIKISGRYGKGLYIVSAIMTLAASGLVVFYPFILPACIILKMLSIPVLLYLFISLTRGLKIYFYLNLGISRVEYYAIPAIVEFIFFVICMIISGMSLDEAFKLYRADYDGLVSFAPKFHPFQHKRFKELSGGEARVVEMFLVLNTDCEFCILDEPFSNIAPIYVEKMQELIKEQKQHKGIIVSDHLYEAIMQVADDLFLLRDGYTFPIKSREELIHHGYILR